MRAETPGGGSRFLACLTGRVSTARPPLVTLAWSDDRPANLLLGSVDARQARLGRLPDRGWQRLRHRARRHRTTGRVRDDWRALPALESRLANEVVYIEVEGWQVNAVNEEIRLDRQERAM